MMDAGKMITTRRMRLRDNSTAHKSSFLNGGGVGVRHFQRNLLLNSRNLHRNCRKNQLRGKHQLPCANTRTGRKANGRHYDVGILSPRNKQCNLTREVDDAICGLLGHRPRQIPGDSLQALFHDMKLYVSDAQVDKMIQCARQGKYMSRKNGASQYLTFGEVCFIASAIQQQQHQQQQKVKENKCTDNFEVFLGGSCNPTTWRTDTAIPELQRHGISYYNPQVSCWAPELVAKEHNAKQSASLLLYVVDSQTRSVVGMIEVAYLVASGRCVVLVAYPYREGQSIMEEPITQKEYLDLMYAQTSLLALVKSQGVKVHTSLAPALQCTANYLRNGSTNCMTADEQVTHKLRKLREVFDSFDTSKTGEINLKSVAEAYQRLTNKTIDLRSLCEYLNANMKDANTRISFDQFCVLVAEFGVDDSFGCETITSPDDWIKKQCNTSSNNNTQNELSNLNNVSTNNTSKSKSLDCDSFDIFLGGSRSNDWRSIVEPMLKAKRVTYCNPVTFNAASPDGAAENAVLQWKKPMDCSKVLLFYITKDTRSLTSMILAAHYIALDRKVVLCVEHLGDEYAEISGEVLTKQAIKDYNRGRVYLRDFAKYKQIPVFDNITDAVEAAIEKSRE